MKFNQLSPVLYTNYLGSTINFYVDMPGFAGPLYINTSGVGELWEKLKDKTRVCYPVENFDYGMREFAVYDNNGYLLQFGEDIPVNAS